MKQTESKELLLSVFGITLLIIIVTGITYAVFRYTSDAKKVNVITTGAIKMSYIESDTNVISINNALPMPDYVGKMQEEYFDFILSSTITGITEINYSIVAETIPTENSLDFNEVKVYLEKKVSGAYEEIVSPLSFNNNSDKGMILYKDSFKNTENIEKNFVDSYRFRMWVDENVSLEDIPRTFKLRINVYAET